MPSQQHHVERLSFSVDVSDLDMALQLRARVQDLVQERLSSVLEQVLDALAPADVRFELGRLDLDLGIIPAERLEHDVPAALELALTQALVEALTATRNAPNPDARALSLPAAAIDDFEAYLVHGILRFRGAEAAPASEIFEHLLATQPDALATMLRRRAHDRHALDRLFLQLDEGELRALLAALAPADSSLILAYHSDLQRLHLRTSAPLPAPALRRATWVLTLEFLLREAGTQFNRRSFVAHLLKGIAATQAIAYAELLALMRDVLAHTRRRQPMAGSLPAVLDALAKEESLGEGAQSASPARAAPPDIGAEALLKDFYAAANDPATLDALVRQLTSSQFAWLIDRLEPAHAALILNYVDALSALHREKALIALSHAALAHQIRLIILRYLLREAGSHFNRRSWLRRMLSRLAAIGGVSMTFLLESLAAALTSVRRRTPLGGSLPAAIAALAADLPAPIDASSFDDADPINALVARVRQHHGNDTELATLIDGMTPDVFATVARRLQPRHAESLLKRIAEIANWQQQRGLVALSERSFALHLRVLALRWLLNGPPSPFRNKPWFAHVASGMAAVAGIDEARLATMLAEADQGMPPVVRDAAALAQMLKRADRRAGADLILSLSPDPALFHRVIAHVGDADLAALLTHFGAAGIAAQEDVAQLERWHAEVALVALDAKAFRNLITALALIQLAKGGAFRRAELRRHLREAIARHEGIPARVIGNWRHIAHVSSPASRAEPHAVDPMTQAERFLRDGGPPSSAAFLTEAAASDPAGFAALLGRLTVAASGKSGALIERLLSWMVPEDIIATLLPGKEDQAAAWAAHLADLPGNSMASAWSQILAAALRGDAIMSVDPPPPGERHDRLALLCFWLDSGTLAWWAPPTIQIEAIVAHLVDLPLPEIYRLFDDVDGDVVAIRLRRAVDQLGASDGAALIERLAPWAFGASGPVATLAAEVPANARDDIRIRAAAATICGTPIDLSHLRQVVPPPPKSAQDVSPPPPARPDPQTLFAWLAGNGPATPTLSTLLSRQLAALADGGDPELDATLRLALARPEVRTRWVGAMTDEIFARVIARIAPARARFLLDAMAILIAAWRQVAPEPLKGGLAILMRTCLLALLAEETVPSPRTALARMVAALPDVTADMSTRLRAQAVELARRGGYANVLGALNQLDLMTQRRPAIVPERAPERSRPPEPKSGDRIYVTNAGLILFNPFLPRFFERIGVLTADAQGVPRVSGIDAASRAVHLLQYLVDERCDAPESDLALNKLLAGIPVAAPIARAITPSKDDRALCLELINAVIDNWPIIKNTSPAGLRETFLQREGRLLKGADHWTLDIERKTLDLLVDQIPWNRSVVYHRWMVEAVHVNW